MLAALIGPIDMNGAIAIVAICIMFMVVVTTYIDKRRSRVEINNDFELAKIKQADSAEATLSREQRIRDVELAQIQQGMITSHSRSSDA